MTPAAATARRSCDSCGAEAVVFSPAHNAHFCIGCGDREMSPEYSGDASRGDRAATGPGAPCAWCERTIPGRNHRGRATRRDAKTCSRACRQALHRFRVGRAAPLEADDRPMRFAYADPPYPGLARRYYGEAAAEVDHAELIGRLCSSYDGWALSTSAGALAEVLAVCPPGVRVCAWVKGARASKARSALNAWEPLIVYGARPEREAVAQYLHDVLIWGGRQHSHPRALVGMKSAAFCEWMLRLLGARQGDEFTDLFPGSGSVTRAWEQYVASGSPRRIESRLTGATRRLEAVTTDGGCDG